MQHETLGDLIQRRLNRRVVVKAGVAMASGVLAVPPSAFAQDAPPDPSSALTFTPVEPAEAGDTLTLPPGYSATPLIRWGDPITASAPLFDPENLSAGAQAVQAGYNCDYIAYLPLPYGSRSSDHGLLVINHEYTNPEMMFPEYDAARTTTEIVKIELAAHGMTVVEVVRRAGVWSYVQDSPFNRRVTGVTPIAVSGPAAGTEWLRTAADTEGRTVIGTLGNCAGGVTPWGTVISGEENFNHYFANASALESEDSVFAVHQRYGVPAGDSAHSWESVYPRFDVSIEPNEPLRFGWPVEIDPYDAAVPIRKRTALGRNKHEGNTAVVSERGNIVLYSGDDERFEYAYKFVTSGLYTPNDRAASQELLDAGTLYVARFNDDGTGQWLPLIHGEGGLDATAGFASQAEVLINARGAADTLGATKLDRPEDMELNPVTGKVYLALTNNTHRGAEGEAGVDAANPRPENRYGHIIELVEAGNDPASTEFTWDIFMLAGDATDESTYFAGYPRELTSSLACPDNLTFDLAGNLWIATNGQPETLGVSDGLFVVPTEGPERGKVRQFLASVTGAEVTGPFFTPDNTALFVSIQHPGEGGTFEQPTTNFPDGGTSRPRPTVVVITKDDGGTIGT